MDNSILLRRIQIQLNQTIIIYLFQELQLQRKIFHRINKKIQEKAI